MAYSLVALLLGACNEPAPASGDGGVDAIKINGTPTGSIQTPSLCERANIDLRVTYTGSDTFAFLWVDDHYEVAYSNQLDGDIYVAHLASTGQLLDVPISVERTAGASRLPSLLRTPDGFVVAWEDDTDRPHVRTHALTRAGFPIGQGHVIAYARSLQTRPTLSRAPCGTAIAWMDQVDNPLNVPDAVGTSSTWVGCLDGDLGLRSDLAPRQVDPATRSGYPWLAGNAGGLALLWSEDPGGAVDPYFARLDAQLGKVAPTNVRGSVQANPALLGRLALTDSGYLAAWEDLRTGEAEIYMSLLDPTGARYGGGLVEEPNTGSAHWPHIAWTGSANAIVYHQFRGGQPQIFMSLVDQTGARISGAADTQVSNSTVYARFPEVMWNGSEFGIMWIDARDGNTELYFNRAVCARPAPI